MQSKLVHGAASTARTGFMTAGAVSAITSAENIAETGELRTSDLRGLIGGYGAYKAGKSKINEMLVKNIYFKEINARKY